jgi:hypothetical protein
MGIEHAGDVVGQRDVGDLELLVVPRVDVDRPGAGEHETRERGLVTVARHHDRVAGARHAHDRDVHAQRRAVRREERLLGARRLGEEPGRLEHRRVHDRADERTEDPVQVGVSRAGTGEALLGRVGRVTERVGDRPSRGTRAADRCAESGESAPWRQL